MKLSLLLKREPFGEILERTLGRYWSRDRECGGGVHWDDATRGRQLWRGNIYLNFFCVDGVENACFDVIRAEFNRSRSKWRRGLQHVYVHTATRRPTRNWLSHVRFSVSPDIPDAREQLLIGGNHRLRIVRPRAGRSQVLHKEGFSRLGFDRELTARQGWAAPVAPLFYGLDGSDDAFAEEYFVGTPANRLPLSIEIQKREEACDLLRRSVHCPSLRVSTIAAWTDHIVTRVAEMFPAAGTSASQLAVTATAFAGSAPLGIVFSHGDFQPANILVGSNRSRIIDWENADDRSQLYDLATLASGIRLASDGLVCWQREVTLWLRNAARPIRLDVPMEGRRAIIAHAAVWLLEEAMLRLEEVKAWSETMPGDRVTRLIEMMQRGRAFLESQAA